MADIVTIAAFQELQKSLLFVVCEEPLFIITLKTLIAILVPGANNGYMMTMIRMIRMMMRTGG